MGLPNEDLPPWLRKEKMQALEEAEGADLPFGVFLLASTLVAIAAVGVVTAHCHAIILGERYGQPCKTASIQTRGREGKRGGGGEEANAVDS